MTTFRALLEERQRKANSILCVGLDPKLALIPECVRRKDVADTLYDFTLDVVSTTAQFASCFKPNFKFFTGKGSRGLAALEGIMPEIRRRHPDIPIIMDSKTTDAAPSAEEEIEYIFDVLGAHAITVFPQPDKEAFPTVLSYPERGLFAVCRMSTPGAGTFQERQVIGHGDRLLLEYKDTAERISRDWDANGNCGLVMGATQHTQTRAVREIVGDSMPILAPGYGRQNANAAVAVPAGVNRSGRGLVASVTGAISFASSGDDYKEAMRARARAFRDEFNKYRVDK